MMACHAARQYGLIGAALVLVWEGHADAQSFTVESVASVDLGEIAAGGNGDTIFRINPATGAVTRISGSGVNVTGGTGRIRVTVSCNNDRKCGTDNARIDVIALGSTNRARRLNAFTVSTSGASGTIAVPPSGFGSWIYFELRPIGRGRSKTFYLGYDFAAAGDDSGLSTGQSTADLLVAASRTNGGQPPSINGGRVSSTVFRTITTNVQRQLSFGRVTKPKTGSGTVSLAPGATQVTTSGDGVGALQGGIVASALVKATGEGGQAVSITVQPQFTMTGGSGSLTVNTSASLSGATSFPGTLGSAGTLQTQVGGSFGVTQSTPVGSYSGNFYVIFQYN